MPIGNTQPSVRLASAGRAGGPAVATIVSEIKGGKPALHVALSSKTLDLMGRLSQQLLSGSITVDEVVKQLAASDQAG